MSAYFNAKRKLRRKLLRSFQPCQEMVPLMSDSMDRPLRMIERLKLELHLLLCAWCTRYLRQIKLIRHALNLKVEECEVRPMLSDEARERIRKSLSKSK